MSTVTKIYIDGEDVNLGSSGHTILKENGDAMPSRSNMQFNNLVLTDDATNNKTIVAAQNSSEVDLSADTSGILPTTKGGTGNNSGYIRTGLKSGANAGSRATAEGYNTEASGSSSHSEGSSSRATADSSHAEGLESLALGAASHSEGKYSTAEGSFSHAEGQSDADGDYSHAEGFRTVAIGEASHSEGYSSTWSTNQIGISASGKGSHAEGLADNSSSSIRASGDGSHAEGYRNAEASGIGSHAEGSYTRASGLYAHAGGYHSVASQTAQTAIGQFNNNKTDTLFEVGNGTNSTSGRSNAFEVTKDGYIRTKGQTAKIAFGIDANGNYGYIKDGADTVIPFKSAPTGTKSITSNGTFDVSNFATASVNIATGTTHTNTYFPEANKASNDMGASHAYRYVNTSGMYKTSGTKNITSNGNNIDVKSYSSVNVNVSTDFVGLNDWHIYDQVSFVKRSSDSLYMWLVRNYYYTTTGRSADTWDAPNWFGLKAAHGSANWNMENGTSFKRDISVNGMLVGYQPLSTSLTKTPKDCLTLNKEELAFITAFMPEMLWVIKTKQENPRF